MATAQEYRRPRDLDEALSLLVDRDDWRIVAGGTDHFPARVAPGPAEPVLDVSGIAELRGIRREGGVFHLGATTTWSDIRDSKCLPPAFDGLRAAAAEVGGRQIQNQGTIAGNLCNASPAADGIPPLLSLDAIVVLARKGGKRRIALSDFVTGYRSTEMRDDELVIDVEIPEASAAGKGGFLKLGARHYLVISIAMVAGVLTLDKAGRVQAVTLSIGACSAVARRLTDLERDLVGVGNSRDAVAVVRPEHFAAIDPIDDPRASAEYRRDAARILTIRLLEALFQLSDSREAA